MQDFTENEMEYAAMTLEVLGLLSKHEVTDGDNTDKFTCDGELRLYVNNFFFGKLRVRHIADRHVEWVFSQAEDEEE